MEATHAFHRDATVDAFLRTVPPGSLDMLDEDRTLRAGGYVIVEVTVSGAVGLLETVFYCDAELVEARFWSVSGQGPGRGVFTLPARVNRAETRQVGS